jgi:hypothetical protein
MAAGERACVELIWRRGSKGLQRGRFLAVRVRPAGVLPRRLARAAGVELPVCWLLVEWPVGKPEPTKYWLSSLPETTPLVDLVGLARLRWRVEQDYRELKGALGLDHFEGRAGPAGTTTSPWSGSAPQIWWRRPELVAAARPAAGSACLLGRRLSDLNRCQVAGSWSCSPGLGGSSQRRMTGPVTVSHVPCPDMNSPAPSLGRG